MPLLTDLLPDEKPVTKVTTATATAKPAAGAAKGPDWDFNENESATPAVKSPRIGPDAEMDLGRGRWRGGRAAAGCRRRRPDDG